VSWLDSGTSPRSGTICWNYGSFEGRLTAEIQREFPGWSLWVDGPMGGERVEQVGIRADRVISEIVHVPGDVLLFGHAHLFRILTARWLSLPADAGRFFVMEPAAPCVLGYEREQRAMLRWNASTSD
jgi:probable phosphoglycerate mutase